MLIHDILKMATEKRAFVPSPNMVQALQAQQAPPQQQAGAVDPAMAAQAGQMDPAMAAAMGGVAPADPAAGQAQMPVDPAAAAPPTPAPTNVADPSAGQPLTIDALDQLFQKYMGQQGGQTGGAPKPKAGGKGADQEIIKNMATDIYHLKNVVTELGSALGVQYSPVDPNRHPETGLPAGADQEQSQPAQPKPAAQKTASADAVGYGIPKIVDKDRSKNVMKIIGAIVKL